MPTYRISEAASLIGVSDDTVRRWADSGLLPTIKEPGSRQAVDGAVLADFLVRRSAEATPVPGTGTSIVAESARNRFHGIVTRVTGTRSWLRWSCRPAPSGWYP